MPLTNIPASILAIAAAAQRAAYDEFAGSASNALNDLWEGGGWAPTARLGAVDERGPAYPGLPDWAFRDGYFEFQNAGAFAAELDGVLVVAFRGSNQFPFDQSDAALNVESQLRLLHEFIERVIDYVRSGAVTTLIVTGHSLGGELAEAFLSIYGNRLVTDIEIDNKGNAIAPQAINLVTFGSPGVPDGVRNIDVNGDGALEAGRVVLSLNPQFNSLALGNTEDPVFMHDGALGWLTTQAHLRLNTDFTITHVIDPSGGFDTRPPYSIVPFFEDHDEHFPALYYQIWTDLTGVGWYENWSQLDRSVYALRSNLPDIFSTANDTFLADPFAGAAILGLWGNDKITGGAGVDYIGGGQGDDTLRGYGGGDFLDGGGGRDSINGGAGSDRFYGGAGTDTAVFDETQTAYRLFRDGGLYAVEHLSTGDVDRFDSSIEQLQFGSALPKTLDQFNWTGVVSPPTPPPIVPTPTPAPPPVAGDDYGNTAATAHSISSNSALAGVIETRGDQDWFRVTLNAGTLYGFSMAGGSFGGVSGLTSPHLYLVDGASQLLAHGSPVSTNSIFSFAPSISGIYYIQARANNDLGTGSYGLAVTPLGPVTPPPPPPSVPGPVVLDLNAVEGSAYEDGPQLIYHVDYNGDLSEDIVIGWTLTPSGAHPIDALDVASMSGTVTLQSTDDDGHVTIRITPQTDHVDEGDEEFELTISVISGAATISDDDAWGTILNDDEGLIQSDVDEHSNTFTGATVLTEHVWSRGFITTVGDVDFFAIDLVAGGTYQVTIIGDDDTSLIGGTEVGLIRLSDPQASLFGPSFNLITDVFNEPVGLSTYAEFEFTANQTGTYYVAVREDGNNDIGQYFIRTIVQNRPDDYAGDASTTAFLLEGQLGVARNERIGDVDWFRVDLSAGQSYSFFAIATGWNGNFIWPGNTEEFEVRVRDAAGNSLAGATEPDGINNGQYNQVTFVAPADGVYYLSVAHPNSNDSDEPYVVGFDAVEPAPSGAPVILQPGPSLGVDASYRDVQTQGEPGINDANLIVGGFWGGNGSAASALRFDLSDLPSEASHAYVEIYLHSVTQNGAATTKPPISMLLGALSAAWDETSPYTEIRDYIRESWLSAPSGTGWYRIDITDLYNAWQSGALANYGLSLLPVDHHTVTNSFYSSDYTGDPSLRPRLIVYEALPQDLLGTNGFDSLVGTGGADRIRALNGDDLISAGAGADIVIGGAGADFINGGDGYDVADYSGSPTGVHVDLTENDATGGDAAGDSLLNVERLSGSSFNDTLIGDNGDNVIVGGAGNDTLDGRAGPDNLNGGNGNDILSGGAGADTMIGGSGNDIYIVDTATDVTTEAAPSGGIDLVQSSVTRTLGANLENLTLTGSLAINGIGNTLANILTGNSFANVLTGGGGADTLKGGPGGDKLNGGTGRDTLTGGNGNDKFVFSAPPNAANRDVISDYNVAADTIQLEKDVFAGLGALGVLVAGKFHIGAAAHDASDRIIYDDTNGRLYFDADGNGAGAKIHFATLDAGLLLTAADFVVI